ncbi:MAG: hypothetical protein H0Z38_09530 [Firmicutes bacterium]|nr:hypothetical protein [Bacillota bacterium]
MTKKSRNKLDIPVLLILLLFAFPGVAAACYGARAIGMGFKVTSNLALRGGFYHGTVTCGAGIQLDRFSGDVVYIPEWEVIQFTWE